MVMLANDLHLKKAPTPMVVTESGMVTVFAAVLPTPHCSHESSPSLLQEGRDTIVVVPSGMLKCPSALTDGAAAAMLPARGMVRVQTSTRLQKSELRAIKTKANECGVQVWWWWVQAELFFFFSFHCFARKFLFSTRGRGRGGPFCLISGSFSHIRTFVQLLNQQTERSSLVRYSTASEVCSS